MSNDANTPAYRDSDQYKAFDVTVADHVAEVTLIGPSKGNAMGPDFWAELVPLFEGIDADKDVRAVVLTGSGKHFSFGLDLPAMGADLAPVLAPDAKAGPRTEFHDMVKRMQRGVNTLADCRKPVVAAVSGWCIGGGVDLITAADIRVASADAKFSVREVKVGMVADMGSLARLPLIVGDGHTRELALTGKDIDAARAEKIGLISDVYDDQGAALAAARGIAAEIAANPPLVVQGVKDVLDHSRSAAVDDSLRFVAAWNAAFLPSADLTEAISAVFEKRTPDFAGE
ncbi:crotonase/enoyl-CoA hydratase family protein [Gordonia humi]|uniref:Enoyl-CoA hydratase n=1 Tax=Gordonia humi TaxID=686429 RepID=A0A840F1S0_9ACTN|nr:crotonase/enoyl-CoA hydratase family protein [Gordonia humi]MBB4136413.1 enoyl-CoA hydratase [Gordonia humi]